MKRHVIIFGLAILILAVSCSEDKNILAPINGGDYAIVSYALERSPKINRLGAGMDFIHTESSADTSYFGASTSDEFYADAVFYNLMVYFTDDKGDVQSEGSPAILLAEDVKALEIGAGVDFFEEFNTISVDMLNSLENEAPIDFESCKNDSGYYDRTLIMAAYDECVIGNKFRGRVLAAPEETDEHDVQPVFLIETSEGGYVKFMVKQFKGDGADKQKTIVQWQILSL